VTRLNLLQGTLDLIVLKVLSGAPLHGYAIAQRIREVSRELLQIEEGSLYPALYRMEKKGWIRSRWGLTEKQRQARMYSLTPLGRKHLVEEETNWEALTGAMGRIMKLG
jgi:transcriptional regulator